MKDTRIQKAIADAGYTSRRKAEELKIAEEKERIEAARKAEVERIAADTQAKKKYEIKAYLFFSACTSRLKASWSEFSTYSKYSAFSILS